MKPWLPVGLLLCTLALLLWGAPSDKQVAFFTLLWAFLLLYQLADLVGAEAAHILPATRHSGLAAAILKNLDAEKNRLHYDPVLKILGRDLVLWLLAGSVYLGFDYGHNRELSRLVVGVLPAVVLLCFLLHPFAEKSRIATLCAGAVMFVGCAGGVVFSAGPVSAPFDPLLAALALYPLWFPARRLLKSPRSLLDAGLLLLLVGGAAAALMVPAGTHSMSIWCAAGGVAGMLWARSAHGRERRYQMFMP